MSFHSDSAELEGDPELGEGVDFAETKPAARLGMVQLPDERDPVISPVDVELESANRNSQLASSSRESFVSQLSGARLQWSFLVSVGGHALLVLLLLNTAVQPPGDSERPVLRIGLVPEAPPPRQQAISPSEDQAVPALPAVESLSPPGNSATQESQPREDVARDSPAPRIVDLPQVQISSSSQGDEARNAQMPSLLTIQQSVQSLDRENRARDWQYDCSPWELENSVKDCQSTQADFGDALENPVYQALNPVREPSRAERSLGTVSENLENVAANLESLQAIPGLSDYLVEELEAGITHLANPGQRGAMEINRMSRLADPVTQQADRVLGDPWVTARQKEKASRQVQQR